MRQRVMTRHGASCNPKLLIAGRADTALTSPSGADPQADARAQGTLRAAIMLSPTISRIVAEPFQRVIVMYAGAQGSRRPTSFELFDRPMHPNCARLMASIPRRRAGLRARRLKRRSPGIVPSLRETIAGLRPFAPRCASPPSGCRRNEAPALADHGGAHLLGAGKPTEGAGVVDPADPSGREPQGQGKIRPCPLY